MAKLLPIEREFSKALATYGKQNYPEIGETPLCTIHQYFANPSTRKHNCIGCNLEDASKLVFNTLKYLREFDSVQESFTLYNMTLYLLVERVYELFEIIQLPIGYRQRHFQVFETVKKWANFLKHPKAFMFVHHPEFVFEADCNKATYDTGDTKFVDTGFIFQYYSGAEKNSKLYRELTNKSNVIVIVPNPSETTKVFCEAILKLVTLIKHNEVYRELLSEKSTLDNYFEDDFEF